MSSVEEEDEGEEDEELHIPRQQPCLNNVSCGTYEHQPEATATSLMLLKEIKDLAVKMSKLQTIKGARYSYCSVVLWNVLFLSARWPQIDLRG